jgi:hypothetical protein
MIPPNAGTVIALPAYPSLTIKATSLTSLGLYVTVCLSLGTETGTIIDKHRELALVNGSKGKPWLMKRTLASIGQVT